MTESKSNVSSKRPPTEAQREAGRRNYRHGRTMNSFRNLVYHQAEFITLEERETIYRIFLQYMHRQKLQRKSYVMCPQCRIALVGKPFRKATKRTALTHARCDICNTDTQAVNANTGHLLLFNRYIKANKLTLEQAIELVYKERPEIFL